MKKKFLTTTALLCCFMVCFAIVADLTGKWTGNINTPDGQQIPVTYNFKVDGTTLTGTADSPQGTVAIDKGLINGNDFSFSVNVGGTDYPHTGKMYADSCGMDIDLGGQKVHFTIKRADK
ncbi:hypothetical protein JN11_01669 [Mucilaginibacter frigoritolerans]|jgi:hypothetical protein|uniref:Glycoside hydrolase n=1 Tax=Mucilaginibacter frigoritolerans TaxID=652788 RepID=A0A562U6W6_9SPHI|nr:glycoside hydrolase [Mucilaginibacter frigoritolerans]TWJ01518.1 hypothetical protein JN11_01669 [Mucilaginibacter frigoritolerans]